MPCNPQVGSDIYLKYIISSKIWRNCASGQTAFRITLSHSRKFLIGVFLSLGSSFCFPLSTVLSGQILYDKRESRNAIFFRVRCWIFSSLLQCIADKTFL